MRTYRCFSPEDFHVGQSLTLDEVESNHLINVRRVKRGEQVIVVNGKGQEVLARLESPGKSSRLVLEESLRQEEKPARTVLASALTKAADFDEILQRAQELGMTDFLPLITERTIIELDEKRTEKRLEKWRQRGIEGLKQCERLWLPEIHTPVRYTSIHDWMTREHLVPIFLRERGEQIPHLLEVAAQKQNRGIALLIGPEGGWSPKEMQQAETHGWQAATLNAAVILRAETAVLAGLALLQR